MVTSIIIFLGSLILEMIINMIISVNSYMVPLFSLLSLIFIYPYLKKDKIKYLLISFMLGFIYDLVFTNFYVLNSFLFLTISYLIYLYFKKLKYNTLNVFVLSILLIFLYNILLFIIFNLTKYNTYNIDSFIFIIKHFFIINLIYALIINLINKKISNNFKSLS